MLCREFGESGHVATQEQHKVKSCGSVFPTRFGQGRALALKEVAMQNLTNAAAEYFVFTLIGLCFVTGIMMRAITAIFTTAMRERSRREIAAYIAEGSMSPEQGERLMRSEVNNQMCRAA
jgi:hypothetical protein